MSKPKTQEQTSALSKMEERNEVFVNQSHFQEMKLQEMKARLPRYINKRKREFAQEFQEYMEFNSFDGQFVPEERKIPMFKIIQHTFRPLIKVAGASPMYSADEISVAFDFYVECVEKLNDTSTYIPKIEDFCRMINISRQTFDHYQNASNDENMRNMCNKIQDYCVARLADGVFSGQSEKIYAIFHQKSSNKQRDNDPVQNNILVQNNTIMSEDQFRDFYLDMSKKFNGES